MSVGAIVRRVLLAYFGIAAAVVMLAALNGCEGGSDHAQQIPVAIMKGDTCAVCGMLIGSYTGPRGEAYVVGLKKPLKFGGTRDFFAYVTQPDLATQLESVFVQDCARIDWNHPSDAAESFVDARKAFYVGFHPLPGEMGPTFASFAKRADAETFIQAHGGALLRYDQITPLMVSRLDFTCPAKDAPLARLVRDCVQKKSLPAVRVPGD